MRAVLDTSVLVSEVVHGYGGITEWAVTSISYAELRYGVAAAKTVEDRVVRAARLERIKDAFGAGLAFDDRAATAYGLLTELVLADGRQPRGRVLDLMIAAVAHVNKAAVLTYNVKDFAGLGKLVPVIAARL